MNTVMKYMRYACYSIVLLLTTSCVKDGLDECPPEGGEYYSYIRFIYEYNMSFEDLFHRQVSSVDVYLFDDDGVYIQKLTDEAGKGKGPTFPKGYVMGLPEDYKETTQFVAFPGVRQERLKASAMTPGVSTINDLYVNLNGSTDYMLDTELDPFWHGSIAYTRTKVERNDTTVISLKKNTNNFRIVFQSLDEDEEEELDVAQFTTQIKIANATYDAYNAITNPQVWTYKPFYQENDLELNAAVVELNTLRLMADGDNRFIVRYEPKNEEILNLNLNKYLNGLKLQQYSNMPLQEFLDREDEYKIIIFLRTEIDGGDPNPKPDKHWIAARVSINGWEIRDQGSEI